MKTIIIINIIATLVAVGIAVTGLSKINRIERTVAEHTEFLNNKENIFVKAVYDSLLEIQRVASQPQK